MFSFLVSSANSLFVTSSEERSFLSYMRTNGYTYTGEEYALRLGVYLTNVRYINDFNKVDRGFRLTANKFASWTPAERRSLLSRPLNRGKIPSSVLTKPVKPLKDIPESFDYRDQGIVNPIKDGLGCGAGWAFADVCAVETAWALFHNNQLYDLSEQCLIDCSDNCEGCDGGQPDWGLYGLISDLDGKIMLTSDYPFVHETSQCKFDESKAVTETYRAIYTPTGKPDDMATLLIQYGPIAAGFDASHDSFTYYDSGIYHEKDCNPWGIDHALAIVGYGVQDGTDYWICRNCWAEDWGMKGYINVLKDENGEVLNVKGALLSDAIGTVAGAALGTSTVTSFVESSSGVAAGARTGLASLVTGVLFLLSLFLSPLFFLIPSAATAPALIFVGYLMMKSVVAIDFEDPTEGIPAFITIMTMPFAYSISKGIMFGIIAYVIAKCAGKKVKDIPVVTWVLAVIFLADIIFEAVK